MTPNSTEITLLVETGFAYLRNMLAEVEGTVKTTPRLRKVSDGDVSLPSCLTGKMADDSISLLFSASNNKVCFVLG